MIADRHKTLAEVGEKVLISNLIKPLLNPQMDANSIGDDCAVVDLGGGLVFCASTDRVPADLVSFRLGIIGFRGLGYYLAVLNLSDIAAMGAKPSGLLLNLAFPPDFRVGDLIDLLNGANDACKKYGVSVIGGDLSSSAELSLSATSLGVAGSERLLRRSGAEIGDAVYCCADVGLTATAFAYFLHAKPRGMLLDSPSEDLLKDQFRKPRPCFEQAWALAHGSRRITAMDNTDGVGQTLSELAEINTLAVVIDEGALPIHDITYQVAEFLNERPLDLALAAGADFQLLGSISTDQELAANTIEGKCNIKLIGRCAEGSGVSVKKVDGSVETLRVSGWNYYSSNEADININVNNASSLRDY